MKLKRIFNSIAFRISVALAGVIAATTIAVGEVALHEEKKTREIELQSKGKYIAELMALNLYRPLIDRDESLLMSLLRGAMNSKDSIIVYGGVFDDNAETIVSAYKAEEYRRIANPSYDFESSSEGILIVEDNAQSLYHVSLPLKSGAGERGGYLALCITKEFMIRTLEVTRQKLYLLGAVIIFMGIMLGLLLTRTLLRPILLLNDGVQIVGSGELGHEVPVVGSGEIRELSLSFNKMSKKLKELISEIESANEQLVRTEKLYAVGEFSAGVAHEIKNPLTSIKMLMQMAQQKKQSLTGKDIKVVEEELNRIDNIVKQFLAIARPEKAEMKEVRINEVLEEVITLTRPMMKQSKIEFEQELASSLPPVEGNSDSLKQVFLNLVLNAVQAMDGKGGALVLKTSSANGSVQVEVIDSGVGIPENNRDKIFDPFFTTKGEGTGVGLTLTHNIVNDHSGKIKVDSSAGKGTAVKVSLPAKYHEGA